VHITRILEKTVPIKSDIANAYISFAEMTVSIVAVETDVIRDGRPVTGFGFNSNGRYAQAGILRERTIPRLMRARPEDYLTEDGSNVDPFKAWKLMMSNEKPGGHGERSVAVGIVDMALWDLAAKIEGKPLYRLLSERYGDGKAEGRVYVYAAGGYYYPGKDLGKLKEEMKRYLAAGYTTVKMKIGAVPLADDLARIEAVLSLLPRGECLAVDANGRYDLETALEYGRAMDPYGLKWYEEPCDPLDFEILKDVCAEVKTPIATGENIFSHQDSRNLLRYGGMRKEKDFLQFDPALSYGLVEYLRTLDVLKDLGWSRRRCIPHGGHQFALQIAAGLGLGGNESYPGVFLPFGGFADGIKVEGGMVMNPDVPGIGIELKNELFREYRDLVK